MKREERFVSDGEGIVFNSYTNNKNMKESNGMKVIPLHETVVSNPRIDKEKGIIRGVKLLNHVSRNNRRYTEKAMREQATMCEGVGVNVNHPESEKVADRPRLFTERIGRIRNARFISVQEGNVGDLHYNTEHPWAKALEWWADNDPAGVALSQNADGGGRIQNGELLVETMHRVRSIDLVADGGTNKSLFEGLLADKLANDEKETEIRKINSIAMDLVTSILGEYGDYEGKDMSVATKKEMVIDVLNEWESALKAETGSSGADSETMTEGLDEMKDVTLEQLKKERPDLVKSVLLEHQNGQEQQALLEENKNLKAQIEKNDIEKKAAARQQRISTLLEESKLPKEAVSDLFQTQLLEAADENAVKSLIEDRRKLWFSNKPANTTKVTSSGKTLLESAGVEGAVSSVDEFAAAVK